MHPLPFNQRVEPNGAEAPSPPRPLPLFLEANEIAFHHAYPGEALAFILGAVVPPMQITHGAAVPATDLHAGDIFAANSFEFDLPPLGITRPQ